MVSSSRPAVGWQPVFKLKSEPLPDTANIKTWAQGKGGWVAQSLTQDLLLPEGMHFYTKAADESLTAWLEWHVIEVTFLIRFFPD